MCDVTYQKHVFSMIVMIVVFWIILVLPGQASEAEEWFEMNAYGSFVPKAEIDDIDTEFSSNGFGISVSARIVELEYDFISYSWNNPDSLPLGNGQEIPWEQLHTFSCRAMYGGEVSEKWTYLILGKGSASFEEKIDESFLEGSLVSGLGYTWSEKWNLLFGGGIKYDDFETAPFPAGGFQWDGGRGFSVSVIFPMESEISYESADERLEASVDVYLDPGAEIKYEFFPSFEGELSYSLSEDTLHRLSNDSPIEPVSMKKYLETASQVVRLELSYSPINHLTCHVDVSYYFARELSILDDNEETIEEFDAADSWGGILALTYSF